MNYSFNIKASSKKLAIEQIDARIRQLAATQPVHRKDKLHLIATAKVFIDMLEDDSKRDVFVSMSGSIGTAVGGIQQIGVSISTHLLQRVAS
uniref:Uncharacterized protein n=1 Tax=viral metagenome TaxID=1070528 RepID=A0A6M3K3E1_9ZZZZ